MASSDDLSLIHKLKDGESFEIWKFQIVIFFKASSLYEIVDGTNMLENLTVDSERNNWKKKDAQAQKAIVTSVDKKLMMHILNCENSHEMFKKICGIFQRENEQQKCNLLQEFFNFRYEKNTDMSLHISKMENLCCRLKTLNQTIDDDMLMSKILSTLPDQFKHFSTAWESTPVSERTLTNLTSRLIAEETRFNQKEATEETVAFRAEDRRQKGFINKKHSNQERKCYLCGKPGHYAKDCYSKNKAMCKICKKTNHKEENCFFRKREGETSGTNSHSHHSKNNDNKVALLSHCFPSQCEEFVVDSGCTSHMTNKADILNCIVDKKSEILVAKKNEKMQAVGRGQLVGEKYILNNVLLVPELSKNLLSVNAVVENGGEVLFKQNEVIVSKNDKEILKGEKEENGLYIVKLFNDKNKSSEESVLAENETEECHLTESLTDWHKKLAHINFEQVRKTLKKHEIKYKEQENPCCTDCLLGKQHRLPFQVSNSRANNICELMHADLCGPFEVASLGQARYFLLIKDDFSGYRFVFFLKHKSEVIDHFEKFIKMVKNQTGCQIQKLRSDNGLEFVNKNLKSLLDSNGIIHETTCPYTPEQNGRAERDMRTLVETIRTMLHSKNLNKNLWAEALNAAVFVLNKVGCNSTRKDTPHKLWFKSDFDITFFREFGTKCSVHIPKQKRTKLDAKSEIGIFVGYSNTVKGYRIYFPDKNEVAIHRDVFFIPENEIETIVSLENKETIKLQQETESDTPEELLENQEHVNIDSETEEEKENQEENIRRLNRRDIRKPVWMRDYDVSFYTETEQTITYEEAIASENSSKWQEAVDQELKVLKENNTWSEVPWPADKKVIESKWVLKQKSDREFKARLVARGFQQDCDIYAPVAKLTTFRMLLVVANMIKQPIHQMDVRGAFLYSDIEEVVYMSLPGNKINNSDFVCKLNKSIYGLKKSPKCWNKKFDSLMIQNDFIRSQNDYCLYSKCKENKLYLLLYVDDVLILGTDKYEVTDLKNLLNKNFQMKDLGVISQYLGIQIEQNLELGYTELSQENYLKNVLKRFQMDNCKSINTPLDNNIDLKIFQSEENNVELQKLCRKIIGSIMYAALATRPDLCKSISILSRFQSKANENLYKSLKRVLRYIQGTIKLKLCFKPNGNILTGFVDSDWGGDTTDRKSTTGFVFKMFDCTISWTSKKQQNVSISSTESEYVALSLAVTEACWLRKLLLDFKLEVNEPIQINEDNRAAICLANSPENNKRLKHLDIKFYFIKEKIDEGIVKIVYVKTEDQIADLFTKPLPRIKFEKFRLALGMKF